MLVNILLLQKLFCRLSQQLNQENPGNSFDCFDTQVAKIFQSSQTTRLSYQTCIDEVVLTAIKLFNCDQKDPHQLTLKVCGREEYLLGSHPLIQYKVRFYPLFQRFEDIQIHCYLHFST